MEDKTMTSKYALVSGEDVKTIIVAVTREDAIHVAKACYGNDAEAINVDYINVYPFAKYRNGIFFNVSEDGTETEAEKIPTDLQRIQSVEGLSEQLMNALAETIGGVK
jgi:hypothetical protein